MSAQAPQAVTWRRDENFPHRRVDEFWVVVDTERRLVHVLNESAGLVWDLLATPRSLSELTAALDATYQVEADELARAVAACLSELVEKHLAVQTTMAQP